MHLHPMDLKSSVRIIKTYHELLKFDTLKDRYNYLKIGGQIGVETFGADRIFNQMFYRSKEWKSVRDFVIARDLGCNLGVRGYEIGYQIIIHHMVSITIKDIEECSEFLMNPEYLITTNLKFHNGIHYGTDFFGMQDYIERSPNDTCPWRK